MEGGKNIVPPITNNYSFCTQSRRRGSVNGLVKALEIDRKVFWEGGMGDSGENRKVGELSKLTSN